MNATRIVSQTSIASDPAQINDAAPGGSLNSAGRGQDFAATLSNVGAKSARRPAAGKAHDGAQSGGSLPAPGNIAPPAANAATVSPPAANPAAAGSAASAIPASNTALPGSAPTNNSAPGRSAASATRAEAAKIEAASAAATALDAAAARGTPTAPATRPAPALAGGNADAAILDIAGQLGALGPEAAPDSAGSASPAVAGSGADFAQALGLPNAAGAGDTQTAVGAAATATDKAITANSAKGLRDSGAANLPKARAGNSAVTVSQSTGRADSANTAPLPSVGSSDNAASPSVNGDSATDGVATLQTAIAAAGSAAAGAAATANSATAEPQADDSEVPVTAGAARPADRANRLPQPPAPVVVPANAPTAAKAASSAEDAALANSIESDKHPHGASSDVLTATDTNGVAGATGLGATASTDATPTPTLKVTAAVDTPEFGHGLADRVSWMVGNNLNGAKLQVNPSQLGPIEVRIAVQGSHAQVWLTSHSAVTRDALESSSQKLRDMLGAQGFGQVSVDISQRSFQERSPQAQPYDWTPSADSAASPAAVSSSAARSAQLSSSAVDAYA